MSLGIESEYGVYGNGRQLDFRRILPELTRHSDLVLHREARHRYVLPDGHKLTCDGWYAELVTPPEPLGPDVPARLSASIARKRNWLLEALDRCGRPTGRRFALRGHSMHFNIEAVRNTPTDDLAHQFALTYGPLFVFLTNHPHSRGILSRPRPGRLEIATEHVSDELRLRATISLFAGAFFALLQRENSPQSSSVPRFDPDALEPTVIRYGWRLIPEAVSSDIRSAGRNASIKRLAGFSGSLQELMNLHWKTLLPHLQKHLSSSEIELAESFVSGSRRCGMEMRSPPPEEVRSEGPAGVSMESERLYRSVLRQRWAGDWLLEPYLVQWDFIVFGASNERERLFVNLPRRYLPEYGQGVWDSALASSLGSFARVVRTSAASRPLAALPDAAEPGIFTSASRVTLERDLEQGKKKKKKKKRRAECTVFVDQYGVVHICTPETFDPQQAAVDQEPAQSAVTVCNRVWVHNGYFGHTSIDHEVQSIGYDFAFVRHYRSGNQNNGILGVGDWDHEYNIRVVPERPADSQAIQGGWCELFNPEKKSGGLTYHHGNGRVTYHRFGSWEIRDVRWCASEFQAVVSTYQQNDGENFEIQRYAVLSGSPPDAVKDPIFYRIRASNGTRILLNCHGYVVEIRDRNFNTMRFAYGEPVGQPRRRPPFNQTTGYEVLTSIRDTSGARYEIEYERLGDIPRIVKLTEVSNGREVEFQYDELVQLTKVLLVRGDAGRPALVYRYARGREPGLLEELVNPAQAASSGAAASIGGIAGAAAGAQPVSYLQNTYNSERRVTQQRVGTPPGITPTAGGTYDIESPAPNKRIVTDRERNKWTYVLKPVENTNVVERVEVDDETFSEGSIQTKTLTTRYDYDPYFHVTLVEYPSKRRERFFHRNVNLPIFHPAPDGELDGVNPPLTYHNDLGRDALLLHRVEPVGTDPPFDTICRYDWLFVSTKEIISPLGTTVFEYDHGACSAPERNGNPIKITRPPQRLPDGGSLPVIEEYEYGLGRGGLPTYYKDADLVESVCEWDGRGRIKSHKVGGQVQARYDYDDARRVIKRFDDRDKPWVEEYDERENLRLLTDPLKHKQELIYDLNDRLAQKKRKMEDDPSSLLSLPEVERQPERDETVVYEYDILGDRLAETQTVTPGQPAASRAWGWEYDREERPVLAKTPRAVAGDRPHAVVRYQYNARGLTSHVTEGYGGDNPGTERTVYDEDGRPGLSIDAMGYKQATAYDAYGRVETITLANGTVVHHEYRGSYLYREWIEGDVIVGPPRPPHDGGPMEKRVLGETHFTFDSRERVIRQAQKVFDPTQRGPEDDEAVIQTWYTAAGRLHKTANPSGTVTRYQYNDQGRIWYATLPGGHIVVYLYDGALVRSTMTLLLPDPAAIAMPPPGSLVLSESRGFDALGRVTHQTEANGVTLEYAYDSVGNRRVIKHPLGLTTLEYDAFSRLERQSINDVSNEFNDNFIRIRRNYDRNDNLTDLWDDLNRHTVATYEDRDLLESVEEPQQPKIVYHRREDGRIDSSTLGHRSRQVIYAYTPSGQVSLIQYLDRAQRSEQSFGYDGLDQVTWCFDSNNTHDRARVQVYRRYDSLGRLTSEETGIPEFNHKKTVGYSYGKNHDEWTVNYPDGSSFTYRVGTDGNVKEIREPSSSVLRRWHQGPGRILDTERGIFVSVQQPQPREIELRLRDRVQHDEKGRPHKRKLWIVAEDNAPSPGVLLDDSTLLPFNYIPNADEQTLYGPHGMIRERDFASFKTEFKYDGAGRLVWSLVSEGSRSRLMELERDGANQLHRVVTTDYRDRQRTTEVTQTITYDPGDGGEPRTRADVIGSRSIDWIFDRHGRLTRSESSEWLVYSRRKFHYSADDRLSRVVFGVLQSNTLGLHYLYDAFGRRVARTRGQVDGDLAAQSREVFVFDGPRCILEYFTDGRPMRTYVYDEMGQIVAYRRVMGGVKADSSSDYQETLPLSLIDGSPWFILNRRINLMELPPGPPGTNASDARRLAYNLDSLPILLEQHISYPFQPPRILRYDYSSGRRERVVTRFSLLPIEGGQRVHHPEDLRYNLSRFYESELQEFITPDRAGAWADPLALGNAYTSAANNPVMFTDTGGEIAFAVAAPILLMGAYWVGTALLAEATGSDIAAAFSPGHRASELWHGETHFGGVPLTGFERGLAAVDVALSVIPGAGFFSKGVAAYKWGAKALMWAHRADQAVTAASAAYGLVALAGIGAALMPGEEDWDDENYCFLAGTLVDTDKGFKAIERIEVGDRVLSRDQWSGEQGYKPVVRLFRSTAEQVVSVTVAPTVAAAPTRPVLCTPGHPWYVQGKGWTFASDLRHGDRLVGAGGETLAIQTVEIRSEHADTFNFEVEGWHTYFVAAVDDAAGVWVHNVSFANMAKTARRVQQKWGGSVTRLNQLIGAAGEGSLGARLLRRPAAYGLIGSQLSVRLGAGMGERRIFDVLFLKRVTRQVLSREIKTGGAVKTLRQVRLDRLLASPLGLKARFVGRHTRRHVRAFLQCEGITGFERGLPRGFTVGDLLHALHSPLAGILTKVYRPT